MNNKELSEHYKLGYKTGFKTAVLSLMKHCNDDGLIDKLIADYNKQPLIDHMTIKEIKS
jgi:hypothetical protein